MPDVFISYKREERPRVERLATALSSLKLDVWFDAELAPGTTFLSEIQDSLAASRAVLVCWTPAAAQSAHVLGEAEHGRVHNKLVASFFAPCALPSPFNMIHAADLSEWSGQAADLQPAWRKVLGEISRLVRRPGILEFVKYAHARDAAALRRWSSDCWKDPLALQALELARSLEAGDAEAISVAGGSFDPSPAPSIQSPGPASEAERLVAHLGPKAQQAAATNDNGEALVNLGRNYVDGFGCAPDNEVARTLFEAAATKGAGAAFFNLGLIYMHGRGVVQSHERARKYFEEAAARGVVDAWVNLGIIHEQGLGAAQDYAKARAYYERAAGAGEDTAVANLGILYAAGRGVRQDWTEARRLFEKAAKQGNANALDNLGTIYALGHGVAPNYALARQCYEAAAAQGHLSALYNLGVYHLEGKGAKQDLPAAFSCFEKAAHLDHPSAMTNLAGMYAMGVGVSPNLDRAVKLFKRAAELGATGALVNLGRIFGNRDSEHFDLAKARDHFSMACDRGDEQGCLHFAAMLAAGEGGAKDIAGALRIYERVSRQSADPAARDMAKSELRRLRP